MPTDDVIGLIPCAGYATRIAPLPCSKEMLPVGNFSAADGSLRPKTVSQYLLEKMRDGGVRRGFLILRKGKWDIPDYYGDGTALGMDLGYLIMRQPYGAPYTLDQAYSFVRGKVVALGFPDILLGPHDPFGQALNRLNATRADLVLGIFRARHAPSSDMVSLDQTGQVHDLLIKPKTTKLLLGWIFAVWSPTFTEYLHEYLKVPRTSAQKPDTKLPLELSVGHVIQAAIRDGIRTQSVIFPRDKYLDIGTPEGLRQATSCSAEKWSAKRAAESKAS